MEEKVAGRRRAEGKREFKNCYSKNFSIIETKQQLMR